LIDLPTGPVAWARSTVIRDRDGYSIGSDEPEVHWGPTYPEDETGWLPLFALPQQTALVEEGVEKIIGPHEPAACGASAPSEPPWDGGEALVYAQRLATVAAGHFGPPEGWKPLPDIMGVLSQIDNSLTGLTRAGGEG